MTLSMESSFFIYLKQILAESDDITTEAVRSPLSKVTTDKHLYEEPLGC